MAVVPPLYLDLRRVGHPLVPYGVRLSLLEVPGLGVPVDLVCAGVVGPDAEPAGGSQAGEGRRLEPEEEAIGSGGQ